MSALVSPRGLASPSRSAKFSSAWREMQRLAQLISCSGTAPLQALPSQKSNQQTPPQALPSYHCGEAKLTHLIILHFHIIHVQV